MSANRKATDAAVRRRFKLRERETKLEAELEEVRAKRRKSGDCGRCNGTGAVMLMDYPFGTDDCPDCG